MPDVFQLLLWFSAFACGAIGAVSLAGMTFITNKLARLEPQRAAEEMLAFVSAVERPFFTVLFFASALSCGALMLLSLPRWNGSERDWPAIWALLGSGFYLLSAFDMSMMLMGHVRSDIRVARDERQDPALWPLFLRVGAFTFLARRSAGSALRPRLSLRSPRVDAACVDRLFRFRAGGWVLREG